MNSHEKELRDIYQGRDFSPEEGLFSPNRRVPQVKTFFSGLIKFLLAVLFIGTIVFSTVGLIEDRWTRPVGAMKSVQKVSPEIPCNALSEKENWIIRYRPQKNADNSREELSATTVKDGAYYIITGEQALREKKYETARHHLETAKRILPDTEGLDHLIGTAYLHQSRFKEAAVYLEKAAEANPSIEIRNNLAVAYIGAEAWAKALQLMTGLLPLANEWPGIYRNSALVCERTGSIEKAKMLYEKYLTAVPSDISAINAYVSLAQNPASQEEMIAFLSGLRALDPLVVYRLKAKLAAEKGDADLAVSALQEISIRVSPRQALAEMRNETFSPIARTKPYKDLLYRLELSAVSLSDKLLNQ
jgi:tetratricopeptide (TPR) repeat protein